MKIKYISHKFNYEYKIYNNIYMNIIINSIINNLKISIHNKNESDFLLEINKINILLYDINCINLENITEILLKILDLPNIFIEKNNILSELKILCNIRLYQKKLLINYDSNKNITDIIVNNLLDIQDISDAKDLFIELEFEILNLSLYKIKSDKDLVLKKNQIIDYTNSFINCIFYNLSENYRKINIPKENILINKFRHIMYELTNNDIYINYSNSIYETCKKEIIFLFNIQIVNIQISHISPIKTYPSQTKLLNELNNNYNFIIILEGIDIYYSILINNNYFLNKSDYDNYNFKFNDEINNTFSVMTYNIYKKEFNESLIEYKPTLIFTQESKKDYIIKDYNLFSSFGNGNEIVNIYNIENIHDKLSIIDKIESILTPSFKRYGIICNYNNIIIANLHLAGGRGYDSILLTNLFNQIFTFKLELLNKILEKNPDIILGDFNSVLPFTEEKNNQSIKKEYLNSQYDYFLKILKTKNQIDNLTEENIININNYNEECFNILKKNKYIYANPENKIFTNIRGNTIVDCIWYKKDKLELLSCKIINLLKDNTLSNVESDIFLSDHNPVIAEFKIKKDINISLQNKYLKYKNKYLKIKYI
jgi:hypothetical protein